MNSVERTRRELLDALLQLSRLRPQWRLGQTVANLAMTAGRLDAGGVWDLEDAEALSAARALIEQSTGIDSQVAEPAAASDGRNGGPGR
jgi:hypothetical protein